MHDHKTQLQVFVHFLQVFWLVYLYWNTTAFSWTVWIASTSCFADYLGLRSSGELVIGRAAADRGIFLLIKLFRRQPAQIYSSHLLVKDVINLITFMFRWCDHLFFSYLTFYYPTPLIGRWNELHWGQFQKSNAVCCVQSCVYLHFSKASQQGW